LLQLKKRKGRGKKSQKKTRRKKNNEGGKIFLRVGGREKEKGGKSGPRRKNGGIFLGNGPLGEML